MSNLYNTLAQLCEQKGISAYRMCKDVGIQPSIMTDLKKGRRSSMKVETASKIASYFGISINEILDEDSDFVSPETQKTPALNKKDERDIAKTLESLKETLENEDGLMFDGDPMSDAAKESILAAMELGLQAAKLKNKEKYTPKKYKKE